MKKAYLYLFILFADYFWIVRISQGKDDVKVMTLNVRYDNPDDSINSWPKRASMVCSFIINEKPDVLGIAGSIMASV